MDSIHGHEVLNMMIESGEQYTHASLEAAIKARFGEQARFHTCSAEGMTAGDCIPSKIKHLMTCRINEVQVKRSSKLSHLAAPFCIFI